MSGSRAVSSRVLVAGEALVDFLPVFQEDAPLGEAATAYRPVPGGSPYNVAIGLARLGVPAGFVGRLSSDRFGRLLRGHLQKNGVDLRHVLEGEGPSTLAFVSTTPESEPEYTFFTENAADQQVYPEDLPYRLSPDVRALHFGSYSIACEPIGTTLIEWAERERGERIISFDPNLRPALIGDPAGYPARLERWIRAAHIVKASRADLEALAPGRPIDDIASSWMTQEAQLVVVTRGGDGVTGFIGRNRIDLPGLPVEVADTVGAGDAFMAGILAALDQQGVLSIAAQEAWSAETLRPILAFAQRVAAITCTREGADPPNRCALEESPPSP